MTTPHAFVDPALADDRDSSPLEAELQAARARIRELEAEVAALRRPSPPSSSTRQIDDKSLLDLILRTVPVVAWEMDRDGVFTFSEGLGLGVVGMGPGEAVGQNVFDLYKDDPATVASLKRVLSGQAHQLIADVGSGSFQSWLWPIHDSNGAVTGAHGVAFDITGRIRAEAAERSSSERFLKAFHSSPAGILLTELATGRILDVNDAFCGLTRFQRDELIGKTTVDVGIWPDAETREAMLHDAIHQQGTCYLENFQLRTRSGKLRPVKYLVEVIELDGQPCALAILQDARPHQRIQRALERSRRRYQTLARFAPVGIFYATRDGHLTYVNDKFRRLFDASSEALLQEGWQEFVQPDDRETLRGQWGQAIQERVALDFEFRIGPPERTVWVRVQLSPAAHADGFIGAVTDVTRRKTAELELQQSNIRLEENVRLRTELLTRTTKTLEEQIFERRQTCEELERSQERWRSLVEEAPDVILVLKTDRTIDYINHTRLRPQLGPERVIGRSVYEFTYPEYHEEMRELLDRVFQGSLSETQAVRGPGDDGQPRWYESHIAPIFHGDRVTGATVVVRDVTAQRLSAEELRMTQHQLAHAGRVSMVGEMTAGFAHELGQPLFAISSYLNGFIIRLQREGAPDELLHAMSDAVAEAHRAIEVVKRLREFLHRNEIERLPTQLNDVALDAVKLVDVSLRKHNVRCSLQLGEDLPPIYGDRIQLMQVVVNLLLNGIEAMSEVPVDDRRLTLETMQTEPNSIECRVIDRGTGLPLGQPDSLFEAFFTTKAQGLGLGLSISRSIVEAHGGRIAATNNTSGPGACFTVRLPCYLQGMP